MPVSFTIWARVLGFRTPIFSATSTISSVSTPSSPQYSGSSTVVFRPMRLVIIAPSFSNFSRGGLSGLGIWNGSFSPSRGTLVGLLPLMSRIVSPPFSAAPTSRLGRRVGTTV